MVFVSRGFQPGSWHNALGELGREIFKTATTVMKKIKDTSG